MSIIKSTDETFKKIPTDLTAIETVIFHIMSEKYSKYQIAHISGLSSVACPNSLSPSSASR